VKIIFRILLVIGLFSIGMTISSYLAGQFLIPKNSGLTGGPMVLFYGLIGAIIFSFLGFILCLKLSVKKLAIFSIFTIVIAALLFSILAMKFYQIQQDRQDPDSAYANLAPFTLSLAQIVIIDPNLTTRIELNSTNRSWAHTLPDGRVCKGTIRATNQRRITEALEILSQLDQQSLSVCKASSEQAQQLLTWELMGSTAPAAKGQLAVSPACIKSSQVVAEVVIAVKRAHLSPTSPVKCQ